MATPLQSAALYLGLRVEQAITLAECNPGDFEDGTCTNNSVLGSLLIHALNQVILVWGPVAKLAKLEKSELEFGRSGIKKLQKLAASSKPNLADDSPYYMPCANSLKQLQTWFHCTLQQLDASENSTSWFRLGQLLTQGASNEHAYSERTTVKEHDLVKHPFPRVPIAWRWEWDHRDHLDELLVQMGFIDTQLLKLAPSSLRYKLEHLPPYLDGWHDVETIAEKLAGTEPVAITGRNAGVNDERDQWLYDRAAEKFPNGTFRYRYCELIKLLNQQICEQKKPWAKLTNTQAISQAIKRHTKRFELLSIERTKRS
jgi:hypothetical protein